MSEWKEKAVEIKTVPTQFIDWGLTDYQEAWNNQEDLLNKTVAIKTENRVNGTHLPTPNYLIFNEHPHVYTLGKVATPKICSLMKKA